MRRFKLRRHKYKARTTTPAPAKGRRRTDPLLSMGDPKFCEGARRHVLGIVNGSLGGGKHAVLLGSSRFNYSVFK